MKKIKWCYSVHFKLLTPYNCSSFIKIVFIASSTLTPYYYPLYYYSLVCKQHSATSCLRLFNGKQSKIKNDKYYFLLDVYLGRAGQRGVEVSDQIWQNLSNKSPGKGEPGPAGWHGDCADWEWQVNLAKTRQNNGYVIRALQAGGWVEVRVFKMEIITNSKQLKIQHKSTLQNWNEHKTPNGRRLLGKSNLSLTLAMFTLNFNLVFSKRISPSRGRQWQLTTGWTYT